jgi:long-subunit fatty acid transport protein
MNNYKVRQLPARMLVAAACLLVWTGDSRALTDEEIFREFPFRFINNGTRSLAMGGAFVAVADDVSAVNANPAGLVALDGLNFYGEFGTLDVDTVVSTAASGSLDVDPVTGERDLPYFGLTSVKNAEKYEGATLVGLAWPLSLGSVDRRLTLVGARQVIVSQESSLSAGSDVTAASFAFEGFPNTVNGNTVEAYSVDTTVSGGSDAEIIYWSMGAALEVHQDFSFGYTLTYATLDIEADTLTEIVDPLELFVDPSHPRLPAQSTTDVYRTIVDGSDEDFAFSIGVHWHPDSVFADGPSPWRLGAVFRKGAEFGVSESTFLNGQPDETFINRIIVPDSYGLGLSYLGGERWLFVGEVERVEFSDMLDGFRSGVNYLTSGRVADGAFGIDPDATITYDVDDEWVPRIGGEYRIPSRRGPGQGAALRAGYYRSPDNRIRMTQFNSDDPDVNEIYLEAFGGGEEENHVTAGFGYTWAGSTFQIAGDFGDESTQILISYTYSLSKKRSASRQP